VLKARAENPRLLIFQGLEWYLPAAEHATVFTAPGPNEADVLRQFELTFDGKLLGRSEGAGLGRPRPARRRSGRSPRAGQPSRDARRPATGRAGGATDPRGDRDDRVAAELPRRAPEARPPRRDPRSGTRPVR
jgi:hypothetical protein